MLSKLALCVTALAVTIGASQYATQRTSAVLCPNALSVSCSVDPTCASVDDADCAAVNGGDTDCVLIPQCVPTDRCECEDIGG